MLRILPGDKVRAGSPPFARRASPDSSHFTKAWTSLRRILPIRCWPSLGKVCNRSALSTILAVPADETWIDCQRVAYARSDSRPARGSAQSPRTIFAVCSSSHACAANLRSKCRACSRPPSSRNRARHRPLVLFWMLAMAHRLSRRRHSRASAGALWIAGLLFEPLEDFAAPVADRPADPKALWSGAEVAPVAQGGDRDADDVGDFGDGEQFVVGVRGLGRCGPVRGCL